MEWYELLVCVVLIFSVNMHSKDAAFNYAMAIAIGMILWNN